MYIFLVVWISLTVIGPILLRKRGAQEGQMIATTLGILGTFLGIVYGLINFDTANITAAVPELLNGLKFAFVTSIAGMSASLIIGAFPRQLGFESGVAGAEASKSESELLGELLLEMRQLNGNIAEENDTTLITQVQKLRTSVNDKQDDLKQSFDEFAKQMAENNMKALIEAINKVMEDFNAKINDQLGENFKRLSEATENLVTWQDQYREQLGITVEALQESNKALGVSVESMGTFTERAQDFENVSSQLKVSLETMGASMTGLKNLADTLEDSGKEIRREMSELTSQNLKDLGENLKGISEKLVEDYSYIQQMMQTVVNKQNSELHEQ
ncbi:MAG: ABC-type transporter Mla subunit MlaD [bacterium]|jgi:ABC-type transporter Mla subunit MlaD